LKEAHKNKYFVDGFLIKHFQIWPIGFDKNNLFEEQKIFIIYLMATIPELVDWTTQVNYKKELEDVQNIKKVKIDQSYLDVAKLQGRNIEDVKTEMLSQERKKKISEINKKYGVEQKNEIPENNISEEKVPEPNENERLWEMLQGRGLTGGK
jgi:hypothetical protein